MNGDTVMPSEACVTVFGSAALRVAPDTASLVLAVSRSDPKPEVAFTQAREGAQAVNTYLRQARIEDFGFSRVTLSTETQSGIGVTSKVIGYRAKITFNVVLRDMDTVDTVLSGIIAAGAHELISVTFETTRLYELRTEARRRAVAAARARAELYCDAAGVAAGAVFSIEDVSPDTLTGRREGHSYRESAPIDDTGEAGAIDPSAITVAAAVNIVYRIRTAA